jgi:D-alanine transaminase
MSRIAYVNGRYLPLRDAMVHVEDRGFQFADSVYEVCEVRRGHLVDETRHLARLDRSLSELGLRWPMSRPALGVILREVVHRNRVKDGLVYLQVTRGAAPRNFILPPAGHPQTLVVIARSLDPGQGAERAAAGVAVATVPDNRWERVDIKTTALLPNVLAKSKARAAGAFEAWFIDRDGFVTEGASTNAWIVTRDGLIVTRPAERGILRGVTRSVVMDLAAREGLTVTERAFTVEEALVAAEAFITAASTIVMPVVRIDERPVGDGRPGRIATRLRAEFHTQAEIAKLRSLPRN